MLEALDDAPVRVLRLGIPDRFIDHGKRELLLDEAGLTASQVAARARSARSARPSRMLVAES